ncbi:MAG: DUF1289 domain-containing protein [Burkholderiales bacterium]|nr:DUF1289 domain-containing protein [Burkholderiales bacterium]
MKPIPSPCIDVCQIDPTHGMCRGCWRTLDEIARWSTMRDGERERVMAQLTARRQTPLPLA